MGTVAQAQVLVLTAQACVGQVAPARIVVLVCTLVVVACVGRGVGRVPAHIAHVAQVVVLHVVFFQMIVVPRNVPVLLLLLLRQVLHLHHVLLVVLHVVVH